jgi:hypothetical protein
MKFLFILSLTTFVLYLTPYPAAAVTVQFLGDANFPAATTIVSSGFYGLSGVAYDEDQHLYYIISDDRAEYGQDGIRSNLALESLAITPNQKFIFTGNEQALKQDGPTATIDNGSQDGPPGIA